MDVMKVLAEHVDREAILVRAWEHGARDCNVDKVNSVYLKISFRFLLSFKKGKQIRFDNMTWKYCLN